MHLKMTHSELILFISRGLCDRHVHVKDLKVRNDRQFGVIFLMEESHITKSMFFRTYSTLLPRTLITLFFKF